MLLDLDTPGFPATLECDVAIVGAGAVGITMAVELARRGVEVTLIEGGGVSLETTSQALMQGEVIGRPHDGLHNARFRLLGGATNFWGGQLVRFDPLVFEPRPWIGSAGWPIGPATLDPYYDRCAGLLGMPANVDEGALWSRLGVSAPDFGADLDFFLTRWARDPVFSKLFRADLAGPGLRTITHANAVRLALDPGSTRCTGVELRSLSGAASTLHAARVVLAGGAIETARLLLHPLADGAAAPWAANPWLGRGFLDHLDCVAGAVRLRDAKAFHRLFDNLYVDGLKYNPKLKLTGAAQAGEQLAGVAGHFVFKSVYLEHLENLKTFARSIRHGRWPARARDLPAHLGALWRVFLPFAVRYLRSRRAFNPSDAGIDLMLMAEQLPVADSRICLGDAEDSLGMRKVRLDWRVSGEELETLAAFAERVQGALGRLGLADVVIDQLLAARDPRYLDGARDYYHHMGGARMGSGPSDGVVDANLKVFGAANLYVAGAAVYPSSGFENPTFTAMALGLRLSDHLVGATP